MGISELKSSFNFTVKLMNTYNDPSQFPRCLLRFVATRMLCSTEVFTCVLYFVFYVLFYHFEFLLSWKVAQLISACTECGKH